MPITTIFDFETPSDYTLTNVTISDAVASLTLAPNPGQSFSQAFTSSSGFTLNSSLSQVTGGLLSQVDQRPANATFYAAWTSQLNANWSGVGNGSITVSAFNGASINNTSNLLDLTGSSNKYVSFSATANTDSLQTFTIEFQITPNYSDAPSDDQVFIDISPTSGSSNDNAIIIDHFTDGYVYVAIYDNGGNQVIDNVFAGYHPTSGQTSTFLLQSNGTTGVTTLFINGSQVSQQTGATYTRSGSITSALVGQYNNGESTNSNFSISNFAFYSAVVTPSTPSLTPTIYMSDVIILPAFDYSGLGSIVAWSNFTTAGDVNSPGYILNGQYWNGIAWVSSNHTYAQSNPLSVIASHISTLNNNNILIIRVITQSSNINTSITAPLSVSYSGQAYPTAGGSIESNSSFSAETVLTFTSVFTASGSDTATFAFVVGLQLMYWNGSAWVNSNGTFAQTNTASVLSTNAASLLSVNSNVGVYALLVSASGTTTPSMTSMTVSYNYGGVEPSPPLTTIVYGYLRDIQSNPVVGASILFSLINSIPNAYMSADDHVLLYSSVTATTDSNGYFEIPIIATTQFDGANTFIQVAIQKGSAIENVGPSGSPLYLTIPVQESIDITSILSA